MAKTLGEIIKAIRLKTFDPKSGEALSQTDFAVQILDLGPTQSKLSQWELDKTQPSFEIVVKLMGLIGIDIIGEVNEKLSGEIEDPAVMKLLSMTKDILKSDTRFSGDLTSNIEGFHRSITLEEIVKNRGTESPFLPKTTPPVTDPDPSDDPPGKTDEKKPKKSPQ